MLANFQTVLMYIGGFTLACIALLPIILIFSTPREIYERDEWDEVYGDQPASPPEGYHRDGKGYRP